MARNIVVLGVHEMIQALNATRPMHLLVAETRKPFAHGKIEKIAT